MTRYYTLAFLPNYVNGGLTQDSVTKGRVEWKPGAFARFCMKQLVGADRSAQLLLLGECNAFACVYNIMVCAVPCPSENSRIHTRPGRIALLANYSGTSDKVPKGHLFQTYANTL